MRTTALFVLILVAGCSTPYQKMGYTGGHDDFRVTENEFEITFRGNQYTREEQVSRFVLRRAAEVTLENGFTHFTSLFEHDRSRVGVHHSSSDSTNMYANAYGSSVYGHGTTFSSGYSKIVVKPATSMRIRCFKTPLPEMEGLVDARGFLRYNFPEALDTLQTKSATSQPGGK